MRSASTSSTAPSTRGCWRTAKGEEVDFVLYGERGLVAIEVKCSARIREAYLRGLRAFLADYPKAKAILTYPGTRTDHDRGIDVVPLEHLLPRMQSIL